MAVERTNHLKKSVATSGMRHPGKRPAIVDDSTQGQTRSMPRQEQQHGSVTLAEWVATSTTASGVPLHVTNKSALLDIVQLIKRAR
jgi:hypothetical protein